MKTVNIYVHLVDFWWVNAYDYPIIMNFLKEKITFLSLNVSYGNNKELNQNKSKICVPV